MKRKEKMKIGIDIGGSHIAVGIVDGNNIINKSETEINKNKTFFIKKSKKISGIRIHYRFRIFPLL